MNGFSAFSYSEDIHKKTANIKLILLSLKRVRNISFDDGSMIGLTAGK